ncbi:MAG: trypsin-like serine peptidase [Bryobacteraceae bacterium]
MPACRIVLVLSALLLPGLIPSQAQTAPRCDDLVDKDGRRWQSRGAVEYAKEVEDATERWERPRHLNVLKPPSQMTLDELAHAMRPVALVNGCEYVREPDVQLAEWVQRYQNTTLTYEGSRGSAPSEPEIEEGPSARTSLKGAGQRMTIIGSDLREKRRDNTSYPMRTQVLLSNLSGGGRCSGTMIGASTMITAAHCVHDGDTWKATKTWSPGVDSQDAVDFPFNPWASYPSNNASNPMVFQCYVVTVPGGYADGADSEWDFAVIEFSNMFPEIQNCNLFPGNTVGWLGWGSQSSSTIEGTTNYIYGYPGNSTATKCGVAGGTCAGGPCNWPQIWGWGRSDVDVDGETLEHRIDTTGGQSGSGVYNKAQGFRKVIGIHQGCNSSTENRARRIDSTVIGFVKSNSAL